jgi:hypothetical protein
MTITGRDVDDAFFARLQAVFDDDAIVELTATIAWENFSSKFNRALRVESQGLWTRQPNRTAPGAQQDGWRDGRAVRRRSSR